MNYCWLDFETSDSRVVWGQLLQSGIVLTDDKFKILEKVDIRCRLKPNIVPSIGALLTNSISVNQLQNEKFSHYELVFQNYKWYKKFSPSYFTGFNSLAFDIEFWRRCLFKYLFPDVYQTNTNGNKMLDILPIIRTAKTINRNVIATEINEKGNDTFRLESLSRINNFNNGKSHEAVTDVLNTISVAGAIKKNCPDVWEASLKTASKLDAEKFINTNKVFSSTEYFYAKTRVFLIRHLFYHPIYNWSIGWDLKNHPKDFFDLDINSLNKKINSTPRPCRTVRHNKSPLLFDKNFGIQFEPYDKIGMKEIMDRAKMIDENPNFVMKIKSIMQSIAEEKMEMNQVDLLPEETIYQGGFVGDKDKVVMKNFHETDLKGKLQLIDKFTDTRYNYFAKCLLYEEIPKKYLPDSIYNEMHRHFAQRLTSTNKEKWETFASFFKECDDYREKYKNHEDKLKILDGYNNYVERMQKNFEHA